MNRNLNNNFLEDDDVEYVEVNDPSEADEIVQAPVDRMTQQTMTALSEAESRIEQANLYKAILSSDLFDPNSARPEIIEKVRAEFNEFVMYRLEVLLGIRQDSGNTSAPEKQLELIFSQDEISALKDIAGRLINKTAGQQVAPPQAQAQPRPVVKTVQVQQQVQQVKQKKIVKRYIQKPGQQAQASAQKPARRARPKSQNQSTVTGEDLSQAVAADRPPVKIPSQAVIDNMHANQAARNARGGSPTTPFSDPNDGGGMGQQTLDIAITRMLNSR